MNKVVWSKRALTHLRDIRGHIEQFNPQAARDLAAALVAAAESLKTFPHRGRLVVGTDKRELVSVHPYIIRYRVVGGTVRVLRIRHTSRRPTDP